ncbi:transcriptional repressor DicA [Slackia heliotrinireducens]|uniref:Looped-hinge helix DNA binding domain, AbrB family n=1 Tax=Slackia heliotrinireducens (strain ATCC 29202 / DSM 20476 / NCTC 11029 / RHS 1) TaxID=471855 RepID=C7N2T8_SLAHD|nr:helix-turn-helix domain-containing protein [Slackia heliotrinireducens]ACV23596.1 looped-hinge helix DNA binding domain, AbrB family [Slackia heliotrinireducens DSM 20476]VEH03062.1 transcriptional repressor DicA [Slackia heliotrinireducens]
MGIAQNILAARQRSGLTQEQLAASVGVSRQTVAKWESGETSPDLEHAAALAATLDTTVDGLVSFDDAGLGIAPPPRGKHLFGSVKVGERGQIVIPKEAREVFGIRPGDKLVVLGEDGQGIALCKESEFMAGVEAVMAAVRRSAL